MTWIYGSAWYGWSEMALFDVPKPFVFRQFVPLVARGLMISGLHADWAILTIIFLTAAGFGYALRYFYKSFWVNEKAGKMIALAGLQMLFPLLGLNQKIYDTSTAFFFVLELALLARNKMMAFYVIYPLVCLNRETAFLLTIIFAVYCFKRVPMKDILIGVSYQGFVYVVIRLCLMVIFSDVPGVALSFRPIENLQLYAEHPILSLALALGFGLVIWLCVRNWRSKPLLLRSAFGVMMPVLMVMFLLFGYCFEIRVFAEVYGVVVVMITSG